MSQYQASVLAPSSITGAANSSRLVSHSSCCPSTSANPAPPSTRLTLRHPVECSKHCLAESCCACRYKQLPTPKRCVLTHGGRCAECLRMEYIEDSLLDKEKSLVKMCRRAINLVNFTQRCQPEHIYTVRLVGRQSTVHQQELDCLLEKAERSMEQLKTITCSTDRQTDCTCSSCEALYDLNLGVAQLKNSICEYILASERVEQSDHKTSFDHIPNDLLAVIFELTLEPGWQTPQTTPLILCAVSQRWRYIAQTDQALWTRIHLNPSFEYSATYSPHASMHPANAEKLAQFSYWLARTGTRPISLTITLSVRYTHTLDHSQPRPLHVSEIHREFNPFVRIINVLGHRWRNLNVQSLHPVLDWIRPAYENNPFLRSLTLTALDSEHPWTDDDIEDEELEDFSVVQSSDSDSVVPDSFCSTTGYTDLNWNLQRVTHIAVQYVGTSRLLDVLQTATDLVECRINHFINSPYPPVGEFTFLEKLVSLYINDTAVQGLDFLADLYVPALRSLSVHLHHEIDDIQSDLIRGFLLNSGCSLLEFEVSSNGLRPQSLLVMAEILFKSPQFCQLERLVLRKLDFNPKGFMYYLRNTSNDKPGKNTLLSRLRSLAYSISTSDLRDEIPWAVVPQVFGGVRPQTRWRRPLGIMEIKHEWHSDCPDGESFLSESGSYTYGELTSRAVNSMIEAIDIGNTLMLPSNITKDDLTRLLQEPLPAKLRKRKSKAKHL